MADQTVRGVVLRRIDSGESDRRLTLFTRELGKLDAVAKGARKGGSRLAGASDPLCESILTFAAGRQTRFVTQAEPQNSFRLIRGDFERLVAGLALAELVAHLLPFDQPDPDLYDWFLASLAFLAEHPKPMVALLWAEVGVLAESGFEPEWTQCVVTGAAAADYAWVSPHAGGVVADEEAGKFTDRFRTRMEVRVALARLRTLAEPPANVRFADECFLTLYPFLKAAVDRPMPAHDSVRDAMSVADV
jgi:DNA repair protein RecO (recombination protein O)